ncbi:MAG TPA: SufD family Fe-S cluster assembly protein, partial [Candidatus Nanopelagicales bacterium]|nr:SufD family Fe-S cluster assembly protein [Candidatus Nanopelagicales bacterium]
MSASTETRVREAAGTSPAADLAPRVLSRDPADFAMPTGREESWRFTPLRRFAALLDGAPSSARLTWDTSLPAGVVLDELPADDPFLATLPLPVDRLSAIAVGNAGAAVRITVPESSPAEPVVLRLRGDDDAAVVQGHVILDVRPFAQATVVLEHSGAAQYAEHLSVLVGEGATLRMVHVQTWDPGTVHAAHVAVRLGRDATLRSFQATLGGSAVRVLETVEYAGPGADAELLGIFFGQAGQHLEHRILVDHAVPHCRSNVLYK